MSFSKIATIAIILTSVSIRLTQAWTYSSPTATAGCTAALDSTGTAGDFSITSVVHAGVSQTLKMAFVLDSNAARNNATAKADIIFIERTGNIKYYTAGTQTVATIGTIPTASLSTATEDGLTGIAVQRVFDNKVYLYYSYSDGDNDLTSAEQSGSNKHGSVIHGSFRISRFDLDPTTHVMNMASEKVLIDIPHFPNRWHTAGALNFDNAGNLYIDVGDNETAFTGPANTHDLRGDILRIHPDNSARGYSIPANNLWEVAASNYAVQGRTVLAARYRDTSVVRPEIYVKGTRNAYTASVNPYNGQLVYSQCGADNQGSSSPSETQNFTSSPMFAGWPFWIGPGVVNPIQTIGGQYGSNGSNEPASSAAYTSAAPPNTAAGMANPVNSWTTDTVVRMGSDTLPPYVQSKYTYIHASNGNSCAMGSVIYHYDGRIANPNKLPPQMDNVWIVGDYIGKSVRAIKVDTSGNLLGAFGAAKIFSTLQTTLNAATIEALTDIQQGPDGALYFVNYQCSNGTSAAVSADACTGISRIEYTGTCQDPNLHPTSIAQRFYLADASWLQVGANSFSVQVKGPYEIQVVDLQGRIVRSLQGREPQDYSLSFLPANGIYFLKVKTGEGTVIREIPRL